MERVYLAIDFESIDTHGTWLSYAMVVAEYPSGKVLEERVSGCKRKLANYHPKTKIFWLKNEDAHGHILTQYGHLDPISEETLLCQFLQSICMKYQDLHVVSDNPQFDIRILDNILRKNKKEPISSRSNSYFPTTCAWSYKQAVMSVLGRSAFKRTKKGGNREVDQNILLRHCPLSDCMRILSNHFHVLDVIESARVNN